MNKTAWSIALVVTLCVSACSIDTTPDDFAIDDQAVATPAPAESQEPVLTEVPAPSDTPEPTPALIEPTPAAPAEPSPAATIEPEEVDDTPVVIDGGDWVTTERDVATMIAFVEETHQLSFTDEVGVIVSSDIGAEFARGFEPFSPEAWFLLRGLGLADTANDRDVANQVRLDRIRGLCCRFDQVPVVVVEVGPTKLATDLIVVHELTHALHTQHPELFTDSFGESFETPQPAAAAFEGVPQFVTFEYMKLAPQVEQDEVIADLPIIRPDMFSLIGSGPSRHLNFAYAAGPAFVDAVVEARGLEGLSDLISSPPTTTEQVLFPQKYLLGEIGRDVGAPEFPSGASRLSGGTVGAAMLMFTLTDVVGQEEAQALVEGWAGDSYVVFNQGADLCLVANIEMDEASQAAALAGPLVDGVSESFPDAQTQVTSNLITLATCGLI